MCHVRKWFRKCLTPAHAARVRSSLFNGPPEDARLPVEADLTAGEIAARFDISKSAVSQHLNILENAGLVERTKKGQFVHYALVRESLANTLNGYLQQICPVSRPLRKEGAAIGASPPDAVEEDEATG